MVDFLEDPFQKIVGIHWEDESESELPGVTCLFEVTAAGSVTDEGTIFSFDKTGSIQVFGLTVVHPSGSSEQSLSLEDVRSEFPDGDPILVSVKARISDVNPPNSTSNVTVKYSLLDENGDVVMSVGPKNGTVATSLSEFAVIRIDRETGEATII